MTRIEIVETITNHLQKILNDQGGEGLTEDRPLRDFPAFDSLAILEALVWLESTFAITIPDEELTVDRFDSVAKMTDYVIDKTAR